MDKKRGEEKKVNRRMEEEDGRRERGELTNRIGREG